MILGITAPPASLRVADRLRRFACFAANKSRHKAQGWQGASLGIGREQTVSMHEGSSTLIVPFEFMRADFLPAVCIYSGDKTEARLTQLVLPGPRPVTIEIYRSTPATGAEGGNSSQNLKRLRVVFRVAAILAALAFGFGYFLDSMWTGMGGNAQYYDPWLWLSGFTLVACGVADFLCGVAAQHTRPHDPAQTVAIRLVIGNEVELTFSKQNRFAAEAYARAFRKYQQSGGTLLAPGQSSDW